jgi:shikimate kinase
MGQSEEIRGLWLLALKGPAGTGKSTLGRALGRRLGWPVVDTTRDLSTLVHECVTWLGQLTPDSSHSGPPE